MKTFEVCGNTLFLALFVDVTNSKELLELMQAGTLEPETGEPVWLDVDEDMIYVTSRGLQCSCLPMWDT
ncbi:hypothetical protein CASFOL_037343 [Castilleja foliolosa]|uniref:Uncharacterized protein n=1 Tax=Castilleja foliolosa TaxID=1961234 RepID=A0ABD3BQ47_9LAMI